MAIVGSAEVRINADGTGFDAQVRRILAGSSGAFRQAGDDAGANWMSGFGNRMRGANGESMLAPMLNSMHRTMGRAGNEHGSTYIDNVSNAIRGGGLENEVERVLRPAERAAGNSGGRAGGNFSRAMSNAFGGDTIKKAEKTADAFQMLWMRAALVQTGVGSLVPIITSLVGGIYSLGTAAASAAGSLGGLLPLMGTMLQTGGTLAVIFKGVGKAVSAGFKEATASTTPTRKAIKAVQTDTTNAQRAIQDARQRVAEVAVANGKRMADAARKVHDAEAALLGSQRNLTQAQRALTAARKDAREELENLAFATEDAALAEQRAQLNLEDAYDALQKVQNLPADNRTRREAELSFKEAELNYREAKDRAGDTAEAQVEASKKGIEGTKAYTSAQKDVISAQNDVQKSEQDLADARRQQHEAAAEGARDMAKAQQNVQRQQADLAKIISENARRQREAAAANAAASSAATKAAAAYQTALASLSPEAQKFVKNLVGMRDTFKQFRQDVQDPFFEKVNKSFTDLVNVMLKTLKPALIATSTILGNMANSFAGTLIDNAGNFADILDINNGILTLFASKTKTGESAMANLVTIFFRLYKAFAPLAVQFVNFIRGLTVMAVKATDGADGMQRLSDFATRAGRRMSGFADIVGSLVGILLGLSKAAGPAADVLLKYFVDSFGKIEKMVGDNQGALTAFFNNSNKTLIPLLDLVGKLALALLKVGGAMDMGPSIKILEGAIEPITKILMAGAEAGPALATLAVAVIKLIGAFAESDSLKTFFNILTDIVNKVTEFIEKPWVQSLLKTVAPILAILHAFTLVRKVIDYVRNVALGGLAKAFKPIGAAIGGMGKALGGGASKRDAAKAGIDAGGKARKGLAGDDGGMGAFASNLDDLRHAFDRTGDAKDRFIDNLDVLRRKFAAPMEGGKITSKEVINRETVAIEGKDTGPRRAAPGPAVKNQAAPRRAALPEVDVDPGGKNQKKAGFMSKAFGAMGGAVRGIGTAFSAVMTVLPAIMGIVSLLMPIFKHLYDTNEGFKKSVDGLMQTFNKLFATIMTAIAPLIEQVIGLVVGLVQQLVPVIVQVVGMITQLFSSLMPTITRVIGSIIDIFKSIMPLITQVIGTVVNIVQSIMPIIMTVIKTVIGIFQSLLPVVTQVIGFVSNIFKTLVPIITQVIGMVVPIIKILANQFLDVLIPVIKLVVQIFGEVLGAILPPLMEIVRVVLSSLMPVFKALVPVFLQVVQAIVGVFGELVRTIIPVVMQIVSVLVSQLLPVFKAMMPIIIQVIQTVIGVFLQLVQTIIPIILQLVQVFIAILIPVIQALLPVIMTVITTVISLFQQLLPVILPVVLTLVQVFVDLVAALLPVILQIVQMFLSLLVPAIKILIPVITFVIGIFVKVLQVALPIIVQVITFIVSTLVKVLIPAIQAIVPVIRAMANIMVSALRGAFGLIQWLWGNVLRPVFNAIKGGIQSVGSGVSAFKDTFIKAIRSAFSYFRDAYNNYIKPILSAFKEAMGKLGEWARSARDAMGKAFEGLVDKIKGPIKDVINGINNWLIKPLNTVVGTFSDKLKIPLISVKGLASGGPVEGRGGPTEDNQLRRLSVGEYVIKESSARKVGKPFLDAVNKGYNPVAGVGGLLSDIKGTIKRGWNEAKGTASDVKNLLRDSVAKRIESLYSKTIDPGLAKLTSGSGWLGKFAHDMLARLKGSVVDWAKGIDRDAAGKFTEPVPTISGSGYGAAKAGRYGGRSFSASQLKNAATIASVARKMGMGDRGALIGIMTAIVESGLTNVHYGDRDSLGLFQQRGPWGSAKNRTTPSWAAAAFYKALKRVKGWKTMNMGRAAQRVQISAFPTRYAQQEGVARAILKAMSKVKDVAGAIMGKGKGGVVWPTTSKALSPNYGGHSGLDVRVSYKPVWASSTGRVQYTGWGKGYGHAMMIRSMGITQIYGHLSKVTKKGGSPIRKGERFGTTGNTGHSTGPHLHLEVASDINTRGRASNRNKTISWYRSHGVKLARGGTVLPTPGGVMAMLAEAGRAERVEPLDRQGMSDRDRAVIRSVVDQLQVSNINNIGGSPVTVRVYIGDTELRDMVHFEIDENNTTISNMLRTGRRRG